MPDSDFAPTLINYYSLPDINFNGQFNKFT